MIQIIDKETKEVIAIVDDETIEVLNANKYEVIYEVRSEDNDNG